MFKDVDAAKEEILAISPSTTHEAQNEKATCSESEPGASKPRPKPKPKPKTQPQKGKLPLALRRLSAHNEAVIR